MKLLFCQDCGDIVAPDRVDRHPRYCACLRHAVWWEDGRAGILRLHDGLTPAKVIEERKYPPRPRAYVIGLTNALLGYDGQSLNAGVVQELIDSHSDYYLFKRWRSLVIRIRPGESGDTAWAARLPEAKGAEHVAAE